MSTPLEELQAIGLTIDVSESAATRIWGALWEIDGAFREASPAPIDASRKAYDAIANSIVVEHTPDAVLVTMISDMVHSFLLARRWASYDRTQLNGILSGPITRWKGRLLKMQADRLEKQEEVERELSRYVDDSDTVTEAATQHQNVPRDDQNRAADCTRSSEVDDFLKRCNAISIPKVYRKHIWQSVGHSKPRQFEYWQACDAEHATGEDERNFNRVLRTKPEDFISQLEPPRAYQEKTVSTLFSSRPRILLVLSSHTRNDPMKSAAGIITSA